MAVAGKAEVEAQRREVGIAVEQFQRAGQPQAQLVAIEGQALGLAEHLGQVDRRAAHLGGDFRQRPAPAEVAGQDDLRPVGQFAASGAGGEAGGQVYGEGALDEPQRQALGLERFGAGVAQPAPQAGQQGLGAGVDRLALAMESEPFAAAQRGLGRDLMKQGGLDGQRQAGVAACHRMADPIFLARVEEEHLARLGHGLVAAQMPREHAAIREDQLRGLGAFLRPMPAAIPATADVPDGQAGRREQGLDGDLGRGFQVGRQGMVNLRQGGRAAAPFLQQPCRRRQDVTAWRDQ